MVFKLRTSKKTMDIYDEISRSTNLQPYCLAKLSISMSLNNPNLLGAEDFKTDNNGLELNNKQLQENSIHLLSV